MSSHKRPYTGQNQPQEPYQIVHAPVDLPKEFPLKISSLYTQGDAPITFLHAHDCLELGYCYEGAGVFVVGGKVLTFRTGDVSFIPASEFHLARSMAGTESKWIWIHLDPERLLETALPDTDFLRTGHLTGKAFRNIITPHMDALVGAVLRELVEEIQEKPRGYRTVAKGLVWTLLARVNRLSPQRRQKPSEDRNSALHRIAPALDRMADRHAERVSLAEWARCCHTSPTHFRRLFHQALGQSPHQYLTELRVRMAATRLYATDEKIVVIAQEVGFPTLSCFNRAFRRLMRTTPRQWRQRR